MPSAQLVSSTLQVLEQPSPLTVLPSSHASPSAAMSTPSPHTPSLHTPLKQTLTAPQLLLSARLMCWQPIPSTQLSVVHALLSSQLSAGGAQVPPEQTSGPVQRLPSLHGALLAVWLQPLVPLQESLVQALPSSQFSAAPATQFAPVHTSGLVQTLPSASHRLPPFCAT